MLPYSLNRFLPIDRGDLNLSKLYWFQSLHITGIIQASGIRLYIIAALILAVTVINSDYTRGSGTDPNESIKTNKSACRNTPRINNFV